MKSGSVVILSLLLCACSSKQANVASTAEEQASAVAEVAYEALYDGRPEAFLEARACASALPGDYRQALLDNYRKHAGEVRSARQGVRQVEATRAQMADDLQLMQVFLSLTYGDGSQEEIVVPMIESKGGWKIK